MRFRVGDVVIGCSIGEAHAEFIAIDARKVVFKAEELRVIENVSLTLVGQTALQMLGRAGVGKANTVLIQGPGGAVGSVVVQIAHERGARTIICQEPGTVERVRSGPGARLCSGLP